MAMATVIKSAKNVYELENGEALDMMLKVKDLLTTYNHVAYGETEGIIKMFGQHGIFWSNKGWIINAMKHHPMYNGNYQITFPFKLKRHVNPTEVRGFATWFECNLYKVEGMTGRLEAQYLDLIYSILDPFLNHEIDNIETVEEIEAWEKEHCVLSAERVEHLTSEFERYGIKVHLNTGMKVSKLVGKLCHMSGIDKVVDMCEEGWYDSNGHYNTKMKDKGYNYQFAHFADNINPFVKDTMAVLSANPIDYYTMSFGDSWASCHTIDKENIRENHDDDHNYEGMYCAGTESYCLDSTTMIFYIVTTKSDTPEYLNKHKRVVVYMDEDKLVQSRIYPDGRDGGDKFLPETLMTTLKGIVSEMFNIENEWVDCGELTKRMIETGYGAEHYPDYKHYDDINLAFLNVNKRINAKRITVGHETICPSCGTTHSDSGYLLCPDCRAPRYTCMVCGSTIRRSNGFMDSNGYWYCRECATICDRCTEVVAINDVVHTEDDYNLCPDCGNMCHVMHNGTLVYRSRNIVTTEEGHMYHWNDSAFCRCGECGNATDNLRVHMMTRHQAEAANNASETVGNTPVELDPEDVWMPIEED